jgi:hypothetical protein
VDTSHAARYGPGVRVDPLSPPEPLELDGPVSDLLREALGDLRAAVDSLEGVMGSAPERSDGPRAAARLLDSLRRAGDAVRDAQRYSAHEVIAGNYLTWRETARALGTTTATIARWRADVTAAAYRARYPDGPPIDPLSAAAWSAAPAEAEDES